MGKGVFPPSILVTPWPELSEQVQSLSTDALFGAILLLGTFPPLCKQAAPWQVWARLQMSLLAPPTFLVALREQIPRKGVSHHHLPCTLPAPSPSSHCFHHAPQSCYKRVSLHGNRHNDQGPGWFSSSWWIFLAGFTSPIVKANFTLTQFPIALVAGSSIVLNSSSEISHSHFCQKPKFVGRVSMATPAGSALFLCSIRFP